jgi:hypothetical protein
MKTLTINNNHFQECDVVMLPTKNKSSLCLDFKKLVQDINLSINCSQSFQHLYILSNDEIKYGDWFIELDLNGKRSSYSNKPYLCDIGNTGGFILTKNDGNFPFPENCRKIIATTDSSLGIENAVKIANASECEIGSSGWIKLKNNNLLPQIPQSFIEYFISKYNKGNVISKVLVELERKKQCDCYYTKFCESQELDFNNYFCQYKGVEYKINVNQNNEISILTEQKTLLSKLQSELQKYIDKKHNQDECSGFIDGFERACELIQENIK